MSSITAHKKTIALALLTTQIWGIEIPIEEVKKRTINESITTSSQVVQLSSDKATLMARLGGKIIAYRVKEGERVKKGQHIATIESIELTSQLAELNGLKRQLRVANKNYEMTKRLYEIGVESLQKLNLQEEEYTQLTTQIQTIQSQLAMVKGRKGNQYSVYAQSDGRVEKILAPIYSIVNSSTPLLSITKGKESFLIKSFIPLKYATKIRVGQNGAIRYGDKEYKMKITQILPNIDQQTQKMTVLSKLYSHVNNLFVNTFLDSKLYFSEGKEYLTVKKTALSFFKNEWVVFVPEHHDDEEEGKEHEEEEAPYDIKVVKILKEFDGYVAIEGLKEHQDYVSDKSYYVKSLLLKSSLGGHGH